jgi:hypothetical protein
LTDAQLKAIKDRIQSLSVGSLDDPSQEDMFFVGNGIFILKNYPSQEIEDLALLLLQNRSYYIKTCAAKTLAKIGTKKSVEPMQQYVDASLQTLDPALRAASGGGMSKASPKIAQQELLQRLRGLELAAGRRNPSDSKQSVEAKSQLTDIAAQTSASDKSGWSMWVIGISSMCGLIWWIVRSRSA